MGNYQSLIDNYFDGLRGAAGSGEDNPFDFTPLCSIDYKNPTVLIKWLCDRLASLQQEGAPRIQNQFRNISFYHGIHSLDNYSDLRSETYDNQPITQSNRFVMNHILEFTHQKQARLMRYSPTINTFPWNNQYKDRIAARLGKKIVDGGFYQHKFDELLQDITLEMAICGESFLFMEWDQFAGEEDTDVAKGIERAERLNTEIVNVQGEKINLQAIKRLGDHRLRVPLPFLVLHEPRPKWKEVDYLFVGEIKHIDQVKAENSHLSEEVLKKITEGGQKDKASNLSASVAGGQGETVIEWVFYHRKTRFVPNGLQAKFFNDTLISAGDLPYSHGELPCCRLTDYDDPVNAHGRSFYESLKLPSVMINNMMKVAYRSFAIAAYPKLIMQQDSCNMYSMANGPFVVEVAPGAMEPKIVSFSAVNKDFFPLNDHVERFMEKNSGTFGISRGDQPANARARSILNFYEEQEAERESNQIRKFSAFIEKAARMYYSNSKDFFKPEDKRTIKLVGRNNAYKLITLNEDTQLSADFDFKVQRTTALSESKQGRIDQISTLQTMPLSGQDTPGLFTREQVLGMIEVADTSTFFETATAAVDHAHSENEDMFEGVEVPSPKEWQAHLIHWNVHFYFMQSREFSATEGVPEEVVTELEDHLRAHEGFLLGKAKSNLQLATILSQNPYFPAVTDMSQEIPLSQIILMLQTPPPPPLPEAPIPGAGGGVGAPLPPEGALPESDVPPPEALPQGDLLPEEAPIIG